MDIGYVGPDGIAAALGPGGIHVSMSTVSPETTQRIAALHAERGAAFVAAPVFGRRARQDHAPAGVGHTAS